MNEKRRRANALMMKYYSGMIDEDAWRHASGNIAVFNTKYRRNLKSLVVQLEPIQAGSGEPSPDNIRPITGRTGATVWRSGLNLLNLETATAKNVYGFTTSINTITGEITISGTYNNVSSGASFAMLTSVPYISGSSVYAFEMNESLIEHTQYLTIPVRWASTTTGSIAIDLKNLINGESYTFKLKPMICMQPIVPEQWLPYTDFSTYSISWETEAGTVYGGELDAVNGTLTADRAFYTFTGLESQYIQQSGRVAVDIGLTTMAGNAICSDFAGVETANGLRYAYIPTTLTAEELKVYMQTHTVQLVYLIANSVTYQLTSQQIQTLLGDNVVWSDAGPVDVEYWG